MSQFAFNFNYDRAIVQEAESHFVDEDEVDEIPTDDDDADDAGVDRELDREFEQ